MSIKHVLIVDDEPDIRELLALTLARMGVESEPAASVAEARRRLAEGHFDLCLTDMRLPDGDGLEIVAHIQRHHPGLPVAVITAYGNVEDAVRALKSGAFDFVSKPVDLEVLRRLVDTALRLGPPRPPEPQGSASRLLGESPAMRQLRQTIAKLARSQAPVFISGESGVGKELVAREIHALGPRAERPFVPVNCGAIPRELMESEFFGHKKGSFTGAVSDKAGLFMAAAGGTLFLDEVADLPLDMQVKLLRAVQERRIKPIGGNEELPVDVRILSASHKSLQAEVAAGRFRQDLYYRLNVIELRVPPLRERREDIPLLAGHFLRRIAAQWGQPPKRLDAAARDALQQYDFPGNVRELENILERACTLSEGDEIIATDLDLPTAPATTAATPTDAADTPQDERDAIRAALERTRWNRTAAARQLGMTLRQLRYRIKKFGLDQE